MDTDRQVISCPHCAKRYAVRPLTKSKQVQCPGCQQGFIASPAEPPQAAPPTTGDAEIVWSDDAGGEEAEAGGLPVLPIVVGAVFVVLLSGGVLWYFTQPDESASDLAVDDTPLPTMQLGGDPSDTSPRRDRAGTAPDGVDAPTPLGDGEVVEVPIRLTEADLGNETRLLAFINARYPSGRVPGDLRSGIVDAAIANHRAGDDARYRELLDYYRGFTVGRDGGKIDTARRLVRAGLVDDGLAFAREIEHPTVYVNFYASLMDTLGAEPGDPAFEQYAEEAWLYVRDRNPSAAEVLARALIRRGDIAMTLARLEVLGDRDNLNNAYNVQALAHHPEALDRAMAMVAEIELRSGRDRSRIWLIDPLAEAGRWSDASAVASQVEDEIVRRRSAIVLHLAERRRGRPLSQPWDALAEAAWVGFERVSTESWHELALAVIEGHLAAGQAEDAQAFFDTYFAALGEVYRESTAIEVADLFHRADEPDRARAIYIQSGKEPYFYSQSGLDEYLKDGRLTRETLGDALAYAKDLKYWPDELMYRLGFEIYAQGLGDEPAWIAYATGDLPEHYLLHLSLGMVEHAQSPR
ncbi:hypothetical protein OT109_09495 [Phycisphaeraceae bacterium D3-23]